MMSYLLITAFIVYELFRFTHTHSLVLLGVIIIDILVIWLIRREHKKLLSKRALKAEADLLP
jgi:uncharacterized membrane protein